MTGFTDNFIWFSGAEYASGLNNDGRFSFVGDFNRVVSLCCSTHGAGVTQFTERGVFVRGTEKKFYQCLLLGLNGMGSVAGRALHRAVIVKGKVFRDSYPVRWDIAYPMSRVIADLVTGIPHGTVMAGEAHLPGADYPFFLKWGEGGSLSMQKKDGNPAVMADGALLGSVGTFWQLHLSRADKGGQAEQYSKEAEKLCRVHRKTI